MTATARPIRVCMHEAAHAVIAHDFGHRVTRIALTDRGGLVEHRGPRRPDPLALGLIGVAGHAAEVLWYRQPVNLAPANDHRWLRSVGFRGQSFSALLMLAQHRLVALEPQVRAVAKALKRGDLDRKAFLAALLSTGGAQ